MKRAHSPQTLVIVDTSFGTFQSVHVTFCVLNIKPLAEERSTERCCAFSQSFQAINQLKYHTSIQRRKLLDLCHTRDLTLNLAHGIQETHNLKAREQGLTGYRTYLGD